MNPAPPVTSARWAELVTQHSLVGMRQRVSFLRTLMAEKDVLLLDEPFGALDSITRGQMQEWLLRALGDVPLTVLLVTHDVDEALLLSKTVVVMFPRPFLTLTLFPALS